jgi:xanthine/CO dehydrogenase XdhC/CoxF family maturation factor
MTQTITIRYEDENGEVTVASTREAIATALMYYLAAESDEDRAAVLAVIASVGRRADRLLTAWVVDRIADSICQTVADNGEQALAEKVETILSDAWASSPRGQPGCYFWHHDYEISAGEYRVVSTERKLRERHAAPFTSFHGEAALVDFVLAYDADDDPRNEAAEKIAKRMGFEVAAREDRRLRRFVKFGDKEGQRRDLLDVVPSLTFGNAA